MKFDEHERPLTTTTEPGGRHHLIVEEKSLKDGLDPGSGGYATPYSIFPFWINATTPLEPPAAGEDRAEDGKKKKEGDGDERSIEQNLPTSTAYSSSSNSSSPATSSPTGLPSPSSPPRPSPVPEVQEVSPVSAGTSPSSSAPSPSSPPATQPPSAPSSSPATQQVNPDGPPLPNATTAWTAERHASNMTATATTTMTTTTVSGPSTGPPHEAPANEAGAGEQEEGESSEDVGDKIGVGGDNSSKVDSVSVDKEELERSLEDQLFSLLDKLAQSYNSTT